MHRTSLFFVVELCTRDHSRLIDAMGNMNEAGKGILLCTKNGSLMLMMTLMPKVNTDLKDIMAHTSWKSTTFKIIS
ncbi:unnamed protein product, partial [Musa banksii]